MPSSAFDYSLGAPVNPDWQHRWEGKPAILATMTDRNHSFAVKRTATGLGLFATTIIPSGKRIIEYTGSLVPNQEVEQRNGRYFFEINTKWSIDGSSRNNTARYLNHSCKPNAEAFVSGHRIWIWSKRDIKNAEEITINYGREYFDDKIKPVGCKCRKCFARPEQLTSQLWEHSTTSHGNKAIIIAVDE